MSRPPMIRISITAPDQGMLISDRIAFALLVLVLIALGYLELTPRQTEKISNKRIRDPAQASAYKESLSEARSNLQRLVSRASDLIRHNWLLLGALLYAYVTTIGIIYSYAIFIKIGINPLSFYDTADFLLAGLRHPAALVIPVVLALINVVFAYLLDIFFIGYFLALNRVFKHEKDFDENTSKRYKKAINLLANFHFYFTVSLNVLTFCWLSAGVKIDHCKYSVRLSVRCTRCFCWRV
jgi:hypothetical protein